tara:strand:+ start:2203 stop:2577 length:375 start_codon:yes stop_codon:yes gene_type:complete
MPSITITFGEMTPVDKFEEDEQGNSCPVATRDADTNNANRESAVETAQYRDPSDSGGFGSTDVCGNCGAYNQTEDILDCIGTDSGEAGYCQLLKFVCSAEYVCDKWVEGGPITSDLDEDYGEFL